VAHPFLLKNILTILQIWSTVTLSSIYVLDPYLETDAGDLFSLAWSPSLQTIFIGCQNTSLQWYDFRQQPAPLSPSSSSSFPSLSSFSDHSNTTSRSTTPPIRKAHKFFDSYPIYERRAADVFAKNGAGFVQSISSSGCDYDINTTISQGYLKIPASNVIDSAHYGYIYCMALLDGQDSVQLVTGSGDESVKVWSCVVCSLWEMLMSGESVVELYRGGTHPCT
jgi:di- and tripeptidase